MSRIRAKLVINREEMPMDFLTPKVSSRCTSSQEKRASPSQHQQKLITILSELNTIFDAIKKEKNENSISELLETRDRKVERDGPKLGAYQLMQSKQLQKWFTKVCSQTFSIAFQQYRNGSMTFPQSKIFCSENILRNLAQITQKNNLKPSSFQQLDNHLKNRVLKYMKTKYPSTESANINKKLNSMVKEIDNYHRSQYDFFHHSSVVFQLRESGNYNDLIMKVINKKLGEIDDVRETQDLGEYGWSSYRRFQNYFFGLFQKVEDQEWMEEKDNQRGLFGTQRGGENMSKRKGTSAAFTHMFGNIAEVAVDQNEKKHLSKRQREQQQQKTRFKNIQKQKYKAKVKEYTHSLIGRKISQNVPLYSQKEIDSLHLVIKHSSILRILTKWCQQLWTKFQNKEYYLNNNDEGLRVQRGGNVNTISVQLKQSLSKLMAEQKNRIDDFMKDIAKNNYEMQESLIKKQLQDSDSCTYIQPLEKACGVFAVKVVNNLHNYIITYLNRLIHGLLKVSQKWFSTNRNILKAQLWPSPPNLLTLKIGDLMRCKCSSKQAEIINLYKHIVKTSRQKPEELKIIRVKNRLKQSTNDILMNVRMFGRYICQIQLSIQTKKSEFIEHSNQFGHYLYELQRSVFGPITELCSIWSTLDPRRTIYQQFLQDSYNFSYEGHLCEQTQTAKFKPFQRPFICSECKVAYSHNYYITKHVKCDNCNYWRCAKCQLERIDEKEILRSIIIDDEVIASCYKIDKNQISGGGGLPQYGMCIYKCSKVPRVQFFKRLFMKNRYYVFGLREGRVYQVAQISPQRKLQDFLKNYLIFGLPKDLGDRVVQIDKEKANYQYLLYKYLAQVYAKQRQSLCLQQEGLTDDLCRQLLGGDAKEKENINYLDLQENQLTSVGLICEEFPNLRFLQLNSNQIESFRGLELLKDLEELHIGHYPMKNGKMPSQICQLTKLENLSVQNVKLQQFPPQIQNCAELKKIELGSNQLQQLPPEIGSMDNLQYLGLYSNKLTKVSPQIGRLKKLQHLLLSDNKLKEVPTTISMLSKLVKLDLQNNMLKKIQFSFCNMSQLRQIDFSHNEISAISADLGVLGLLEVVNLSFNRLKKLPDRIRWKQLAHFNANHNRIEEISQTFYSCANLQKIQLSHNKIRQVGDEIRNMKKLRSLNLASNQIVECTQGIGALEELSFLSVSNNKISKIFSSIGRLSKLQYFYASSNVIEEIPLSIRTCISLKQLYLGDNSIKTVPQNLSGLSQLEENHLDLSQNPLQVIQCPQFVLNRGDYMTKKLVKEKLNMEVQENEEVGMGNLQILKEAGHKKSLRGRRGEVADPGKRSVSSNK